MYALYLSSTPREQGEHQTAVCCTAPNAFPFNKGKVLNDIAEVGVPEMAESSVWQIGDILAIDKNASKVGIDNQAHHIQ